MIEQRDIARSKFLQLQPLPNVYIAALISLRLIGKSTLHSFAPIALLCAATSAYSQQPAQLTSCLPEAPSPVASITQLAEAALNSSSSSSSSSNPFDYNLYPAGYEPQATVPATIPVTIQAAQDSDKPAAKSAKPEILDADGNPIPLNRQQPKRILGFMPNYRSVAAGAKPHPPGWAYNFKVATRQSFDYSSFIFLGITSLSAEGINSHPALGKGVAGFYGYTWRGFLDKTDGTYLGAWLLPSLLHEDTRFYPLGSGHSVVTRSLYVISRQAVTRTYGGRQTPNIAGLGGKVLTQVISRNYYPTGSTDFSTLATKFAYSAMRDVAFSSIREFYPDIAAHYIRKHREKAAAMATQDTTTSGVHN